eukprot:11182876-Lingulodinium_polyedra.AAC.1
MDCQSCAAKPRKCMRSYASRRPWARITHLRSAGDPSCGPPSQHSTLPRHLGPPWLHGNACRRRNNIARCCVHLAPTIFDYASPTGGRNLI